MKHQILRCAALIIAFVLSSNLSAQDAWKLSAKDGFDNMYNTTVFGMNVFGGKLYAAAGPDSGYVYRSNTGNINSWTKVFSNPGSASIDAINSTPAGGGNIYIASNGSWFDTSRVYRSNDGITWSPYFVSSTHVSYIVPFKGLGLNDSIYLVDANSNGDRILKSHYDSNDPMNLSSSWDTVLNFEISSPLTSITSVGKHNSKLFVGTSGAQLFSSADGNNWVLNPNVGFGFGDADNKGITALTSFMGNIYAGTDNNVDGAQIWKSSDEISWTLVYQFPYFNDKISSLTIADGKLWVTAQGLTDGKVSKSIDGSTFITSDSSSFGNPGNNGRYASIIQFGNNIYWGGEHNYMGGKSAGLNGAQIWRLCTLTPPTVNLGADQIVCPGVMVTLNAGPSAVEYIWQNEATTQTTDVSAPGYFSVEYIGINGCSAYDTIFIDALPAPEVNITNPIPSFAGGPYTVCSGINTNMTATAISNVYTPEPPINKITNDSISDMIAPVYDTINVSGITSACACDALMSVTIDSSYHTYAGDLVLRIYAPDGSNILLSQQRGGSADNSYFGTIFRMNALNWISFATPPFSGAFKPEGNFHDLTGNPNGAWALNIQDVAGGDDGNLKGWSIRFKVDDTVMTYSWTPATGLSSVNTLSTIASPTVATTYSLTATNTIGCSTQQTLNYDVPALNIPMTADTVCYGGNINLSVLGGTFATSWFPTAGLTNTTGDSTVASPLISTTYYVSDTISGCPVSDSIHVYANAQMFLTDPAPVTICLGDTTDLTASANGGSGPYTYTWDLGGTYFYGETITQSPTSGTSYTISATDIAGCSVSGGSTNIAVTPSTEIKGHVEYSGGAVTGSTVVLYRYFPFMIHFDTIAATTTDGSGNFNFGPVNHFEYLIEVFPNASYTNLVPTYYGNEYLWEDATKLIHDCNMTDSVNIIAVEETIIPGPGSLSGTILEGVGFTRTPGDPVPGIDVKLGRNPGGQLVTSTQTDSNGDYAFSGIGYDSYRIYVDIPGLGMDSSYVVTVDSVTSDFIDLDYYVDDTSIYIVEGPTAISNSISKENSFSVYPNPSKGNAFVEYTIAEESQVSLGVYNLLGVKLTEIVNVKQFVGAYKYSIGNRNSILHSGIYFIKLIVNDKVFINRLVITE